jgi:hypothetical protein
MHMSSIAMPLQDTKPRRWIQWAGWAVSLWPAFVVGSSATWKLSHNAWYVNEFGRIGWQVSSLELLAFLQLSAMVLFLIPRTAVLGAILLSGYLGGAIASYVRIQEFNPPLVPLSTAMIAWLGLWLRDERVRSLLPYRRG